jgi:folate-dependent phosphoribosylglycinamide formyltransferase PurN
MKIVLLTNNSGPAKFIANHLYEKGLLDAAIIEDGTIKKKKKIFREIKSTPWARIPIKFLDLLAIYIYSQFTKSYIEKHLLRRSNIKIFPKKLICHEVKNASGLHSISILKSLTPDIIIVLGTSILKPEVLTIANQYTLNIHGGIVPQYRNVHSDFWAIKKKDFNSIGTSIIHLDPGIDTGQIAIQGFLKVKPHDSLFSIKIKNIELSLDLILKAIDMVKNGNLPKTIQKDIIGGFHKTPGFLDFLGWFTSNTINIERFS